MVCANFVGTDGRSRLNRWEKTVANLRLLCDNEVETDPDPVQVDRVVLIFKRLALTVLSTMPPEFYPEQGYHQPPLN